MTKEELSKILQRRPKRGLLLFRILYGALIAATALSFFLPISWGWTLSAFLLGIVSLLARNSAIDRILMSRVVAENPASVYWAHSPTTIGDPSVFDAPARAGISLKYQSLTLHLRIGKQFDLLLSRPEKDQVIAWLRESNPQIRWGDFYPSLPAAPAIPT